MIAAGTAPKIKQPEEGATYECIQKKDNSKVGRVFTQGFGPVFWSSTYPLLYIVLINCSHDLYTTLRIRENNLCIAQCII